jgi:hypothetical protein
MASEFTDLPAFLATREGEAYNAQYSTNDYGNVGDQRPYQVVFPGYPAPKWLSRFAYLKDALRECGTLCQLTGQPFRLVKWGSRLPCYPCRGRKRTNELPGLKIISPGALRGFPHAQPVADFHPTTGTIVYDKRGQPKIVGQPNFMVSRTPTPPENYVNFDTPMPVRYQEAVHTAQYLANATGKNSYICSSMGASCKVKGRPGTNMKWKPLVYVSPGGLVARYPHDLRLRGASSVKGSTTAINPVTTDEFRGLLRESAGASRLGQGH